jgi:ABC-type uncharacterized transport system involved in gliding motility auxiliary subunit
MVVLGNSQFIANGWFQQQLNADVFLNTVSWLSQPDQTFSIAPKLMKNRRIVMTIFQSRLLSWLAMVILPLFAFVVGAIIWWKRR